MNNSTIKELIKYTGKGIKIGIIDSGIDFCQPIFSNQKPKGVNFYYKNKTIINNNDYYDENGHGSSVAGIIKSKAINSEIYSIKILDKKLRSRSATLAKAIDWSIENGMNVINISLGTTNNKNIDLLEAICKKAYKQRIIVVSALPNDGNRSLPACFKEVLAIESGKFVDSWDFAYDKYSNTWIAKGDPQLVYGVYPDMLFLGGTSIAAPHLTGIIACLLEKYPNADLEKVTKLLKKLTLKLSKYEFNRIVGYKEIDYSITPVQMKEIFNNNKYELEIIVNIISKKSGIEVNRIKYYDNLFRDIRIRSDCFYRIAKSLEKEFDVEFNERDFSLETFFSPSNLAWSILHKKRSCGIQDVC